MMRNLGLLFFLAILSTKISFAQPDTAWTAHVNIGTNIEIYDAVEHTNGDFFLCGEVQNAGASFNGLMVRMNSQGDTVWTRIYVQSNSVQRLYSIIELQNGNLVACGMTGNESTLLVCYNVNGNLLWNDSLTAGSSTQGRGVVALPDGGFAAIGYRPVGPSNRDLWLLRYNNAGDTLWSRTYGTAFTDLAEDIVVLPNGQFVIAGYSDYFGTGNWEFILIHADANGNQLNFDHYGETGQEECHAFIPYENDTYLLGGYYRVSPNDGRLGTVAKIDSDNLLEWQELYNPDSNQCWIRGISILLESGIILVGNTGDGSSTRLWIGTCGPTGNLIDSWTWGPTNSLFQQIIRASDGGYLAVGHWNGGGLKQGYVLRIVPPSGIAGIVTDVETGDPLPGVRISTTDITLYAVTDSLGHYELSLGAGTHDIVAYGACFDTDTMFNVVVEELQTVEVNLSVGVPHLLQNQTSINIIAQNQVLSTGLLTLENTGSGRLYFRTTIGSMDPPSDWLSVNPSEGWVSPHESFDAVVEILADTTNDAVYEFFATIHVSTNSCPDSTFSLPVIATVLDADKPNAVISEFALHSAYPNPFNGATTIKFDLPQHDHVALDLFDIHGRLVSTLVSSEFDAGSHVIEIDLSNQASGFYLARLQTSNYTLSRRLVLLK